jgi:hypothetical protein
MKQYFLRLNHTIIVPFDLEELKALMREERTASSLQKDSSLFCPP